MSLQNIGMTRESMRGAAASEAEGEREEAILLCLFFSVFDWGGRKAQR